MKFGVVYPQIEYPTDPIAIRDYAQAAEGLGYTHIVAYDHVLGANPDRPGGWQGPYTYQHTFMEQFVLFSYMAGLTHKLEFVTGILILPQRQTALVAKQAACLDVLCGGRLRLGVGLGWNQVEYIALNQPFHNRGRRLEEQVEVLRRLWAQPLVDFKGKWHTIPDAGINPLPVRREIPIWFGGHAQPVLRRAARLGQGWMPNYRNPTEAQPALEMLDRFLEEFGRQPRSAENGFGLEVRLPYGQADLASWEATVQGWEQLGATHLDINTMGCGFKTPKEHLDAIERFAGAMGLI